MLSFLSYFNGVMKFVQVRNFESGSEQTFLASKKNNGSEFQIYKHSLLTLKFPHEVSMIKRAQLSKRTSLQSLLEVVLTSKSLAFEINCEFRDYAKVSGYLQ